MHFIKYALFSLLFCSSSFAFAADHGHSHAHENLGNLKTEASLDMIAPFEFDHSDHNQLYFRSAEIIFFGSLDKTFDMTLNLGAHEHDGEFVFEAHEAYISSVALIPNSRLNVGKFLLNVGRLNQMHQHDWDFISAPRVQSEFFDEEAIHDTGFEFSTLLPTSASWDITLGVTNGATYGHSHGAGAKPRVPTHYIHPVHTIDFADKSSLQWGLNYLGRTDAEGLQTQLYGLDFTFQNPQSFLFQSEIWYRNTNENGNSRTEQVGAYFYPQVSLSERLFAGLRADLFKKLNLTSETDGRAQDNLIYALVPTFTYKHSGSTILRAAYTIDTQRLEGESDVVEQKIELQWIAILGGA